MPRDNYSRTVYTTETGRICPDCGKPVDACRCKKGRTGSSAPRGGTRPAGAAPQSSPPKPDGFVRLMLEKKGRGGKTVTVITGLPGSEDELRTLAAELKRRCGTGGTLKDGVVEIQGDHRDSLIEVLQAKGLKVKRVGG